MLFRWILNAITVALYEGDKGRFGSTISQGDNEASCFAAAFEDEGRNHKLKNSKNAALEVTKDKETDSTPYPPRFMREHGPADTFIWLSEIDVGLLTSMTIRE